MIPAKEVTIGDLVVLKAGDRVPADCRIVENSELSIDESLLTGESVPVEKGCTDHRTNDYSEQVCAFMGDDCAARTRQGGGLPNRRGDTHGRNRSDAGLHRAAANPLAEKKLDQLGKSIAIGCLVICALVSGVGILRGEPVMEMLITGISLAVAAIPEGLPAIVTIALALSVNRMVKKNAVIRRLHAVETLGCANVICSDKTGTLTENRMTVKQLLCGGTEGLRSAETGWKTADCKSQVGRCWHKMTATFGAHWRLRRCVAMHASKTAGAEWAQGVCRWMESLPRLPLQSPP